MQGPCGSRALFKLTLLVGVAGMAILALAWGTARLVRADPAPDPTIGTGALTVDGASAEPPSHWLVHQSTTYHMHIDGISEYGNGTVISAFVKGKDHGGVPFVDEIPGLTISAGSIGFDYTIRDTSCQTAVVAYGREGLLSNAGAIDPAHSGSAAHLKTVDAVGEVIDCVPTVGGIVEIQVNGSGSAVDSVATSPAAGSSILYYVALALPSAAGAIAVAAGGWYASRRWLR